MKTKSIQNLDLKGKRVLIRVDFNVPLKDGRVQDDTRITAALPTIQYVLKQGASVVLMSHLGRPGGTVNSEYSLQPVAEYLKTLVAQPVQFVSSCVGPEAEEASASLEPGSILVLENLRFHAAEEGKGVDSSEQETFAEHLSRHADVYINDAFGTSHRAHASISGIVKYFDQAAAGFLLEKEVNYLGTALESPAKPFLAIIGGAKISGKIDVITHLLGKVDSLIIGGGMAYTFFKARGEKIGNSICEDDKLDLARQIISEAQAKGVQLLLPLDNVIADEYSNDATIETVDAGQIPEGWEGLDIGPKSRAQFAEVIHEAKTIVWNGPMGCFEMPNFSAGTNAIAEAVAASEAVSIIGGGDSVSAVKQAGLADQMTHISTGGGASLEFLEGKILPGVAALTEE